MEAIIGAIIGGLVSLIVCLINNKYQQDKNRALIEYKLDQLTLRVEKHNSLVERTYQLEEDIQVQSEKIKSAHKRMDGLEKRIEQ